MYAAESGNKNLIKKRSNTYEYNGESMSVAYLSDNNKYSLVWPEEKINEPYSHRPMKVIDLQENINKLAEILNKGPIIRPIVIFESQPTNKLTPSIYFDRPFYKDKFCIIVVPPLNDENKEQQNNFMIGHLLARMFVNQNGLDHTETSDHFKYLKKLSLRAFTLGPLALLFSCYGNPSGDNHIIFLTIAGTALIATLTHFIVVVGCLLNIQQNNAFESQKELLCDTISFYINNKIMRNVDECQLLDTIPAPTFLEKVIFGKYSNIAARKLNIKTLSQQSDDDMVTTIQHQFNHAQTMHKFL